MKNLLIFFALNIFFSNLGKYNGWEKTWAGIFLTKKEIKDFKKIKTEKEAEEFVRNFWKRRDPTPNTEENEFKERCEVLAKYADNQFSIKGKKGSETDRGKVLLLLGYPSQIKRQDFSYFKEKQQEIKGESFDYEIEEVIHTLEGGPMEYESITLEIWVYKQETLPFEIPSENLFIIFKKGKDERDFYLHLNSKEILEILEKTKIRYIISEE